ncbi:MAG: dihydroorotase [Actinomycetota bacterium]|nr:dihydroorotase [Actinomycetota bacterium]
MEIKKPDILVKNAEVIDPYRNKKFKSDIFISKGLIAEVADSIESSGKVRIIEAKGLTVSPSLIDMHVHLRDPGDDREEDIISGIKSALAGGFTTIACMPNTMPALDCPYLVKYIASQAKINDFNLLPVAAMTKGLEGKEITEMGLLLGSGAAAFSDDGKCVQDSRLMFEIMRYAQQLKALLILHEEDYQFSAEGLVHEGYYANKYGLEGISALSEELVIARDLMLAAKTGARIHITHVSTAGTVEMIREAKMNKIQVTCDVTPHHLYFEHSSLGSFNPNLKVKPPLRGPEDREALIEGVKDGTIDAIASDHAPHLNAEKNTTMKDAAFGVIGMETSFKAAYSKLCAEQKMDLLDLLKLYTSGPSSILGLDPVPIETGIAANLVVIDTKKEGKVGPNFYSKSNNCPFIGHNLKGEVLYTINNGNLSYIRE